jgi:hypothetical protein
VKRRRWWIQGGGGCGLGGRSRYPADTDYHRGRELFRIYSTQAVRYGDALPDKVLDPRTLLKIRGVDRKRSGPAPGHAVTLAKLRAAMKTSGKRTLREVLAEMARK